MGRIKSRREGITMTENKKLEGTLFQLATAMREKRSRIYPFGRDICKNKMEIACEADHEYMKMNLTEEQRTLIDDMLEKRMDAAGCELTLTYLSGLLDGIVFLRDSGFLDMYMMEDTLDSGDVGDRDNARYLIALLPEMDGCIAVRVQSMDALSEQIRDLQCRGSELHVISRPEDYGGYGPYRFAASMEDFQKQREDHMNRSETDEEDSSIEGKMGEVPEDTQVQKEI